MATAAMHPLTNILVLVMWDPLNTEVTEPRSLQNPGAPHRTSEPTPLPKFVTQNFTRRAVVSSWSI
jgi:hypothetical protein